MQHATATVIAVCCNPAPGLPKPVVDAVHLLADWGVEGDYHAGRFVRHRHLAKKDPTQPNLRQVLISDAQTFTALATTDIQIGPGDLGENITISGLPLLELPLHSYLAIGEAIVEIIEVRTPCKQLNGVDPQLLQAVTKKDGPKRATWLAS